MIDKVLETSIPFSGFYNSFHDQGLDDALEQMFSNDRGNVYEGIRDRAFDKVNWSQVHNDYAKEYAECLGIKFNLKTLKFLEMTSPKYYNFTTDRIFCNINLSEVTEIFNKVDKALLRQTIKDSFTSYDGFISFYPNDLDEWPKELSDWDANHVGTLLTVYIRQENDGKFDQWDELEVFDYANEVAYNFVSNNIQDADRLFKVLDYLRTREERVS